MWSSRTQQYLRQEAIKSLIGKEKSVECDTVDEFRNQRVNDELKQTVRLIRRARVKTDDRGRTVWGEEVEDAELELVSTQMLQQMLTTDDEERRQKLKEAAETRDGILARNTTTRGFEIIDDGDLEAALSSASQDTGPARVSDVIYEPVVAPDGEEEELSLVSTQMLRQMLGAEEDEEQQQANEQKPEEGFDPYNSG